MPVTLLASLRDNHLEAALKPLDLSLQEHNTRRALAGQKPNFPFKLLHRLVQDLNHGLDEHALQHIPQLTRHGEVADADGRPRPRAALLRQVREREAQLEHERKQNGHEHVDVHVGIAVVAGEEVGDTRRRLLRALQDLA